MKTETLEILKEYQAKIEKDIEVQKALQNYLSENGLVFREKLLFAPSIDCIAVYVSNYDTSPILFIGLPPLSDYVVNDANGIGRNIAAPGNVAV